MAGPFIPKCTITQPNTACLLTQYKYACKITEWIWIDTSDYFPYGYDLDSVYSYKEGSGHRAQ